MADDAVAVTTELKATDPIKDDPTLPRVLLIGDSISIGCASHTPHASHAAARARAPPHIQYCGVHSLILVYKVVHGFRPAKYIHSLQLYSGEIIRLLRKIVNLADTPECMLLLKIVACVSWTPDHFAVRNALEGVANVHRPDENCGPTTNGVEKLQAWLEQHGERPWDVIHFNFGCKINTVDVSRSASPP